MPWPFHDLPWAPVSTVTARSDPYHHGDTDAISIDGLQAVLRDLPKPSAHGNGWAEWQLADGRAVLQASRIEFVRDQLWVAHPRLWVFRAGVPALIEPDIAQARERPLAETVRFMREAVAEALG